MNNSILLWLVLLYCMHAQGTPMACHWMEEGLAGRRECMEPHAYFQSASQEIFGAVNSLCWSTLLPKCNGGRILRKHYLIVADTAWFHGSDSSA